MMRDWILLVKCGRYRCAADGRDGKCTVLEGKIIHHPDDKACVEVPRGRHAAEGCQGTSNQRNDSGRACGTPRQNLGRSRDRKVT